MKTADRSCIAGHRQTSDKRAIWLFSADAGACKRGKTIAKPVTCSWTSVECFLAKFYLFLWEQKIILLKPDLFCKSILSHVWQMLQWIKQIWEFKLSCLWPFCFIFYSILFFLSWMCLIKLILALTVCSHMRAVLGHFSQCGRSAAMQPQHVEQNVTSRMESKQNSLFSI